jgi:hypothetical protein
VGDLAAGQQLEVDPLVGEPRRQRLAAVDDLLGVEREHVGDVRGRRHRARSGRHGGPRHLQRGLRRRGPVVDAGEDVSVQIDHCTP